MTRDKFKQALEERVQIAYGNVPEYIKKDIYTAARWASNTLTNHEGSGHIIQISAVYQQEGVVCCSFSKPSWPGDHCGRGMETGSEAIVMAVCEYLNGA